MKKSEFLILEFRKLAVLFSLVGVFFVVAGSAEDGKSNEDDTSVTASDIISDSSDKDIKVCGQYIEKKKGKEQYLFYDDGIVSGTQIWYKVSRKALDKLRKAENKEPMKDMDFYCIKGDAISYEVSRGVYKHEIVKITRVRKD